MSNRQLPKLAVQITEEEGVRKLIINGITIAEGNELSISDLPITIKVIDLSEILGQGHLDRPQYGVILRTNSGRWRPWSNSHGDPRSFDSPKEALDAVDDLIDNLFRLSP